MTAISAYLSTLSSKCNDLQSILQAFINAQDIQNSITQKNLQELQKCSSQVQLSRPILKKKVGMCHAKKHLLKEATVLLDKQIESLTRTKTLITNRMKHMTVAPQIKAAIPLFISPPTITRAPVPPPARDPVLPSTSSLADRQLPSPQTTVKCTKVIVVPRNSPQICYTIPNVVKVALKEMMAGTGPPVELPICHMSDPPWTDFQLMFVRIDNSNVGVCIRSLKTVAGHISRVKVDFAIPRKIDKSSSLVCVCSMWSQPFLILSMVLLHSAIKQATAPIILELTYVP